MGTDGTWSGKLKFEDTPESDAEQSWTAVLSVGTVHFKWKVTVEEPFIEPPVKVQDPIIASDNNLINEPLTVTQRAIVNNATKASETWIKDGVDLNVTGDTYTPTEEASFSFKEVFTGDDGSTVTATSNVLTIEDDEEDTTKPTAVMSGLRFDSAREASLSRAGFSLASSSWTISFWIKLTGTGTHYIANIREGINEIVLVYAGGS